MLDDEGSIPSTKATVRYQMETGIKLFWWVNYRTHVELTWPSAYSYPVVLHAERGSLGQRHCL